MPSAITELSEPLVDTNVMFDFLLWRFCIANQTPLPGCISDYFSTEVSRKALLWYLDEAKPIHTSPHVIAEINGLVRGKTGWRKDQTRLSKFWRFAKEELARLQLSEHLLEVAEMNGDDLGAFGPTDCAILQLAIPMDGVVVTEDGDLRRRILKEGIRVLSCKDILDLWQKSNA
jgi:rRNA-processing protein FCF1